MWAWSISNLRSGIPRVRFVPTTAYNLSAQTDGLFGYYEGVDEDEYQIVINSTLTRDDIVETLFHELVHINQHSKGDFDQELRLWKGKKYDCLYLDLPWEVQAFHHQDIMMEEYRNKRKDSLWNRHLNTMIPVTSGNGPRWKKILKSLKKGEIGDLQRDEEALYCICNKRDIHYDQTLWIRQRPSQASSARRPLWLQHSTLWKEEILFLAEAKETYAEHLEMEMIIQMQRDMVEAS